jgi:3-dehydroquinate synthase
MILQKRIIHTSTHTYPVMMAENFDELSDLISSFSDISKIFILTEDHLKKQFEDQISKKLSGPIWIVMKGGEKNKHLRELQTTFESLVKQGIDRKSLIIALGGGVVGDYSGFVASTILRGIRFISIPTSILATVDSSVGGKVAVNLDIGKNMIGSFYPPYGVYASLNSYESLPEREWSCGIAEMLKHSFLEGGLHIEYFESNSRESLFQDKEILSKAMDLSIQFKASIVSQDEKETGLRSILNLGHTLGHALESLTHYEKFAHGEAVAMGLSFALYLSLLKLNLKESSMIRGLNLLKKYKLPIQSAKEFDPNDLWEHAQHDKKKDSSGLKFILLKEFGDYEFGVLITKKEFLNAWDRYSKDS